MCSSDLIVRGASLAVADGEIVALLGPNGAGKSTLIGVLTGALAVRRGTALVLGEDPRSASGVGYLPQDAQWPGQFTVREFLGYLAWCRGVPRRVRAERVDFALEHVDLIGQAGTRLGRLSGGQRRRAMLAQTLLQDPALLVLDEPTTGFDPAQRVLFRALIGRLSVGRTVVMATHLVEDVELAASWVCVLRDGRVAYDGSAAALVQGRAVAHEGERQTSPLEAAFVRLVS